MQTLTPDLTLPSSPISSSHPFHPRDQIPWIKTVRLKGRKIDSSSYSRSQDELMKVRLDNHILHAVHSDLQEVCVCRVGGMRIDFLARVPIQAAELLVEKPARGLQVRWIAGVFGEVLGDRVRGELIPEQVDLIEKEDDGRSQEPLRVGNGLEKHQRLTHLILPTQRVSDGRLQIPSSHHGRFRRTASLSSTKH